MASAINVGSINLPKMMRQLSHRTSQVRDLTFFREAIKQKDVKTTKSGAGGTLEGPAVSFGYEKSSSESAEEGTDTAYHQSSPEIVLPGLTMLQSPIVSRRGRLEKSGHRISGACKFYAPSLDYIKALDNFKDTKAFAELESYDRLYDMERIIQNPADRLIGFTGTQTITFPDSTTGYEIDRVRFKIKTGDTLDYVQLSGNIDGSAATLKWDGSLALSSSTFITVDLPIHKVKDASSEGGDNSKASIYKDGIRTEFLADKTGDFDVDKLYGDSSNELSSLIIALSGSSAVELRDIYLYKEAEWRIESIRDYRDEYMLVAAVRVRGDRASRRRAYG
jgi:hypothetical protein